MTKSTDVPFIIEISNPKTKIGRNRLREHGTKWRLIKMDTLNDKPALLTESLKDGYLRWWMVGEIEYIEVKA